MSRAVFQNVDLCWVIFFYLASTPGCRSADADSCHEVKTAYMMRQIGQVELVPDTPQTDGSLRVCVHSGLGCCTSKMEDGYMAAVRSETQQKIRSFSFELKYLIAGHSKAYRDTFDSLVSFTSNLTSNLFDSAYSSLASECRPHVLQLFNAVRGHLSGEPEASLERAVGTFFNELFPLVYGRLLNPGMGQPSPPSFSAQEECLRMTRQDVGISELAAPWRRLVLLLQRLAGTLATSSNRNSMELALLAVRNHVDDAILHAQLHGPRITAIVEKVCGSHAAGPVMMSGHPNTSHVTKATGRMMQRATKRTPLTSLGFPSLQLQTQRSFPLKGSRGDKSRSLKKLSREFEGSIQRYQLLFSELPEMLCESETEVEQHACWSGRDVVESYAGGVVASTLKAQRDNPEMSVRDPDPALRAAKHRLEQLTQRSSAGRTKPQEKGRKRRTGGVHKQKRKGPVEMIAMMKMAVKHLWPQSGDGGQGWSCPSPAHSSSSGLSPAGGRSRMGQRAHCGTTAFELGRRPVAAVAIAEPLSCEMTESVLACLRGTLKGRACVCLKAVGPLIFTTVRIRACVGL
ncbi:glypican-5-like isoform 3-T3 [Syngnathus typhle]